MTVKELYDLFMEFKSNEFSHLVRKVDGLIYGVIALLAGVIASICILLFK